MSKSAIQSPSIFAELRVKNVNVSNLPKISFKDNHKLAVTNARNPVIARREESFLL